jgi:hypothetical protein
MEETRQDFDAESDCPWPSLLSSRQVKYELAIAQECEEEEDLPMDLDGGGEEEESAPQHEETVLKETEGAFTTRRRREQENVAPQGIPKVILLQILAHWASWLEQ